MPEDVAGQAGDPQDASANGTAPSPAQGSAPDIESIRAELSQSLKTEMEQEFEKRAAGFQRVIAERDAELRALKTAGLSEDEREQLARQESEAAMAALKRENELLKLAREYPEEMPLFERVLQAPTAKAQLEAFRALKAELAPKAPAPASEPELDVPDVLSDNPPRRTEGNVLPDGTVMSDALAERLLGSAGRGALHLGR